MSQYSYSPLSPGANNIRLLRLMRPAKESTQRTKIQCELFEYSLQDLGKGTHLYEALSYTWGGEEKPCSITIEKHNLNVTANLYAALLHLRDCSLDRIIWIDAICINQDNTTERAQQVKLMALIYSKAHRVLVWLGETGDTEGALENIQLAANEEPTERSNNKINEKAIFNLLQRQWFQRIWVLQEVAAARHIIIMCGSTEIDGYAFCVGLKSLRKSQELSYAELQGLPPLTNLIKRAGLRPKRLIDSLEAYSLKICSLAELVDMFHTRQAKDPRDKVYALLGISSDNYCNASLQPDYEISWEKLFHQFVKLVLSENTAVETFSQKAVIKSKGCILGQVSSVRRDNRQNVSITSRNAAWDLGGKKEWTFQATAIPIQKHDIICLLSGASKPTIIRLCKDHFAIVLIAATPLRRSSSFDWPEITQPITHFLRDFLLVWDWENPLGKSQDQEEYKALTKIYSQTLEYPKVTRLWNDIMILDDLGEYENADERLPEARSGFMAAFKKEHLPRLDSQYGRTLLSFAAGEGHEDTVKLLLETVDPDLKDGKSGRTPLLWAADHGHKAVVKLLLETGKVNADLKNEDGHTPLSCAAGNGHSAVVKLLLETGKVDADSNDRLSRTPLSQAAENGHEAIVKLLLETGKVNADSKDDYGQTPLSQAVWGGHEATVKILLETGKVNANSKDRNGRTLLSQAAWEGRSAAFQLLLKTGKFDADSKDQNDQRPLLWAARSGHSAMVKLLLETGKVDADSKDIYGRTPLSEAAENGHSAIVKLLLETGKVDADSKDRLSRTPLSQAAENGHEAIVKLLLETGKANADSKDDYGQTPLSQAAENGHSAIVKLLLETGKADADWKDQDSEKLLLQAAKSRYKGRHEGRYQAAARDWQGRRRLEGSGW